MDAANNTFEEESINNTEILGEVEVADEDVSDEMKYNNEENGFKP